ncbi:MAG: rod shape-determining protein [Coprococcus sp.]|nr:rod shape-determining protein [Coprococcus sp.]
MDIGIDLGTSNVLVSVRGRGVVINQPSVVAYEVATKRIIAIGTKAKKMIGKTPDTIEVVRPLIKGVISDYTITERMLKAFIRSAMEKRTGMGRPKICVCVPSGVTEVERRAVEDAVYRTGAKSVYVMEEPLAAAVGASVDIFEAKGNMVVDIGGGTTDIAVVSLGGAVESHSIKCAGDDYNAAMIRYVRRKYNLLIGEQTAEKAKIAVGSVYPREENIEFVIKGRDLIRGLPKAITITANETIEAFAEPTTQIMNAIHNVLEIAPPELVADISIAGIVLTGGGSLIYGMDKLIKEKTGIEAYVSEKALEAVALGAGMSVSLASKNAENQR